MTPTPFSELVYRGLAHDTCEFAAGTYFTLHEDLARWYASNKYEEYGIVGWVVSFCLELSNVVVLDTDEIEWIGYDPNRMGHYVSQGYDGARNISGTEIVTFSAMHLGHSHESKLQPLLTAVA